jgi:hypothetical protein
MNGLFGVRYDHRDAQFLEHCEFRYPALDQHPRAVDFAKKKLHISSVVETG